MMGGDFRLKNFCSALVFSIYYSCQCISISFKESFILKKSIPKITMKVWRNDLLVLTLIIFAFVVFSCFRLLLKSKEKTFSFTFLATICSARFQSFFALLMPSTYSPSYHVYIDEIPIAHICRPILCLEVIFPINKLYQWVKKIFIVNPYLSVTNKQTSINP